MPAFAVKTENFEGPLEVLLNLIEGRKLSISEISLAKVADDFVHYTKRFETFPIAEGAAFILVAATLLLIKSKSLLPGLQLTDEEKTDIGDLERRLSAYQKVRALAGPIRARFGTHPLFALEERPRMPVFSPDASCTPLVLRDALFALLAQIPKTTTLPKAVVEKVITLDEMMGRLTERIQGALRLGFRDFSGNVSKTKKDVIVGFLAMLELVRRGALRVSQEKHFGDIVMETDIVGVPQYR